MVNPLTATLSKVFRDRSQWTSLERLRREGHENVRVLDVATLDQFIAQAVERALPQGFDPATGEKVARAAQVEFVKLVGEKESLERTTTALRREQEHLERNAEQAREALGEAQAELDASLARKHGERLQGLLLRAEELIDGSLEPLREHTGEPLEPGALDALRRGVLDQLKGLLARALREGRSTEGGPDSEEVALLERRIGKLNASLSEARQLLGRLQGGEEEDSGVASVHREVQGLRGDEADYEKRSSLLREVFQMNLELRQQTKDEALPAAPQKSGGLRRLGSIRKDTGSDSK